MRWSFITHCSFFCIAGEVEVIEEEELDEVELYQPLFIFCIAGELSLIHI